MKRIIPTLIFLVFYANAFASPKLPATVTWIGNSYPGGDGKHVPQDIDALCVTPDGRVFSNVFWEEGGGNVTEFKDGKVLGSAGHTHGWGNIGGKGGSGDTLKGCFLVVSEVEGDTRRER